MWPNIENVTVINILHIFDQMYISPLLRLSALKEDVGLISEYYTVSVNQDQRTSPSVRLFMTRFTSELARGNECIILPGVWVQELEACQRISKFATFIAYLLAILRQMPCFANNS